MQYLLKHFAEWQLCLVFVAVCIGSSMLLLWVFRNYFSITAFREHREVGSIIFGTISLIYSLILAFVIVAVWEDYEELHTDIVREAAKLTDMRFHAAELPVVLSQLVLDNVKGYAELEVKNEWTDNENSLHHNPIMLQLRHKLLIVGGQDTGKVEDINVINKDIDDITELRYSRIGHVHSHVPFLVWVILILGSFVMVFFSYLFVAESGSVHYLFTSILTGMLAMCLFLLFALDHPLSGTAAVSPAPFLQAATGGGPY